MRVEWGNNFYKIPREIPGMWKALCTCLLLLCSFHLPLLQSVFDLLEGSVSPSCPGHLQMSLDLSGPSNSMSLKWHLSACPLPHLQNPQLSERPHPRDLLIRWGRKEMEGGWCSGSGKPTARSCCQPSLILSRVCPCSGPHPSISWRMASGSRARGQET